MTLAALAAALAACAVIAVEPHGEIARRRPHLLRKHEFTVIAQLYKSCG